MITGDTVTRWSEDEEGFERGVRLLRETLLPVIPLPSRVLPLPTVLSLPLSLPAELPLPELLPAEFCGDVSQWHDREKIGRGANV